MRILAQTGGRPWRDAFRGVALTLGACAALVVGAGVANAQEGRIQCTITENGAPSRGTVAVEQDGRKVASGSCGRALPVPPGKCKVTVILDGALDNPARTVDVDVVAGKTAPVAVNFETATLEVRIETKGQRGTGLVAVEKGGKRIGTLGSGVAARLSAGAYVVVVRLGGQEQRHTVELRPGQRRLVRAQF